MAEKSIPLLSGILEYTHSGRALTGTGKNGKFKATSSGAKSSFTVNGVSYGVRSGEDTEIELVNGLWYTFILDTAAKTINFNMGGAVMSSFPDGTSVTPVNDVKIWQKCAGLSAQYTSVSSILNDEQTLKSIILSSNATEYLKRSTAIQESVFASSKAVEFLDSSLAYTTPDMLSNTSPYGECTTNANTQSPLIYQAFCTDKLSYYISDSAGKYLQWKHNVPFWAYKFRIYDAYGGGSVIIVQGIKSDGSTVDLSGDITVPNKTIVEKTLKPNTEKIVGIRIYIKTASTQANNWVQYGSVKVWGK